MAELRWKKKRNVPSAQRVSTGLSLCLPNYFEI